MKITLYARVSSEQQAEKDLSIPAQLKALKDHAIKKGWEVVSEFVDAAESARTANRPAFQKMIAQAKQKPLPFDGILVWKLSRFARNREDSIMYKALLRRKGVQVISMNEQIDESPSGRLLEGMIETMDEFYSANLGQDTRRGMKENAQRGFLNGAPMPYGYNAIYKDVNGVKKRAMELNENEAPTVRQIFSLFTQGQGAKNIAQYLNERGIYTRHGRPWSKNGILYILKNETYTGILVWNRQNESTGAIVPNPKADQIRVPEHHAALIDQASFDKIQGQIAQRSPKQTHPQIVASNHVLSGLVFCAQCGARMIASTAKSGRFVYYSCQRKFKEGKASCSQTSLNAKKLEPCIIGIVRDRLLTEAHLSKLVSMVFEELQSRDGESSDRILVIKSQLDEIEKKLRRYYQLIETDNLPLGDVAERLRELNAAKNSLREEQNNCESTARRISAPMPSAERVKAYVADLRDTLQQGSIMGQKAFLRSFIKRIGIRGTEAEIEYTCPLGVTGGRNEVLSIAKGGVANGTRTRNNKLHKLGLYH